MPETLVCHLCGIQDKRVQNSTFVARLKPPIQSFYKVSLVLVRREGLSSRLQSLLTQMCLSDTIFTPRQLLGAHHTHYRSTVLDFKGPTDSADQRALFGALY